MAGGLESFSGDQLLLRSVSEEHDNGTHRRRLSFEKSVETENGNGCTLTTSSSSHTTASASSPSSGERQKNLHMLSRLLADPRRSIALPSRQPQQLRRVSVSATDLVATESYARRLAAFAAYSPSPSPSPSRPGSFILPPVVPATCLDSIFRKLAQMCRGCLPLVERVARASDFVSPSVSRNSPRTTKLPRPPRRWYRVHPVGENQYFVRPDAGQRGRIPGTQHLEFEKNGNEAPDVQLLKSRRKGSCYLSGSRSVPDFIERKIGVSDPPGFECDSFRNCCRICYDEGVEVVLLPCRHGVMCHSCLKKTLYSRPSHRGGRNCPFCRKRVREVIYIYGDAAIPQYGFTLKIGLL